MKIVELWKNNHICSCKRCYIGPLMLLDAGQEVALSCALFANH